MAKTFNDGILPVSFWAESDYSAKQYYVAAMSACPGYATLAGGASDPYPLGIIQEGDSASMAVSIKVLGFTRAVVDSRDSVGNACPVIPGTLLTCGSESKLMVAGASGPAFAKSMGALSTGSAILNVLFYGVHGGDTVAAS